MSAISQTKPTMTNTKPPEHRQQTKAPRCRVGLAFQGGCFLAGAVGAGVVRALVEERVFDTHNVRVFSGTSAGALVAAACWTQAMQGLIKQLPLQHTIAPLSKHLESMWLENAYSLIPNQQVGDWAKNFDRGARHNLIYDWMAQNFGATAMRGFFKGWIRKYIDRENLKACVANVYTKYRLIKQSIAGYQAKRDAEQLKRIFNNDLSLPRLVLGSADVLQGEIMAFSEYDVAVAAEEGYEAAIREGDTEEAALRQAYEEGTNRLYDFIEASGSLEEVNGTTRITKGDHEGTYLDGAWGQNPPVNELLNYSVDEIWIVEIFPKLRAQPPKTYAEREDRKEELTQNALVEHELHMIDKVNEWIRRGRLFANYGDYRDFLAWRAEKDENRTGSKAIDELSEEEFLTYRPVKTLRMPMNLNLTPGARIVNSPSYIRDKMDYGYCNARHFLAVHCP